MKKIGLMICFLLLLVSVVGFASAYDYEITISSDENNVVVKDKLTALGWNGTSIVDVLVTINSGVKIGSSNSSLAAFDTGVLPAGSKVRLVNNGGIYGAGGAGGARGANSCSTSTRGKDGAAGGTAIKNSVEIVIVNSGDIFAGGGGGGGGGSTGLLSYGCVYGKGGGGGGGQGFVGGVAVVGRTGDGTTSGTFNSSGNGGSDYCASFSHQNGAGTIYGGEGGDGGTWGQAGTPGEKPAACVYCSKCVAYRATWRGDWALGGRGGYSIEGCGSGISLINNGQVLGNYEDAACVELNPGDTNTCSSSDQIIMKLSDSEDAVGGLWNNSDSSLGYEICYNQIFGSNYTGSSPHECTGNNGLVLLDGNDTASTTGTKNVCYGDLDCKVVPNGGACSAGYNVVLRLDSENNSLISAAGKNASAHPIAICCASGGATGNAYWANTNGNAIVSADKQDTVKMMIKGSGITGVANYTIMKDVTFWFNKEIATQSSEEAYGVWKADTAGNYYFKATLESGEVFESGMLTVTNTIDDSPMIVKVTNPTCGQNFTEGAISEISVQLLDEDDIIEGNIDYIKWSDRSESIGTSEKLFDVSNGIFSMNYTFDFAGSNEISVDVNNTRGQSKKKTISLMIIDPNTERTYAAACIDSPEDMERLETGDVEFDASSSRGVKYSPSKPEAERFFEIPKDNMRFNWNINVVNMNGNLQKYEHLHTEGSDLLSYHFFVKVNYPGNNNAALDLWVSATGNFSGVE